MSNTHPEEQPLSDEIISIENIPSTLNETSAMASSQFTRTQTLELEAEIQQMMANCPSTTESKSLYSTQWLSMARQGQVLVLDINLPKEEILQKYHALKAENESLKQKLQAVSHSNHLELESLQTKIEHFQKLLEEKDALILSIKNQTMKKGDQFTLLEIPVQTRNQTEQNIKQIPVYIEKEIIQEIPVPIFLSHSSSEQIKQRMISQQTEQFFEKMKKTSSIIGEISLQPIHKVKTLDEFARVIQSQENSKLKHSLIQILRVSSQTSSENKSLEQNTSMIPMNQIQSQVDEAKRGNFYSQQFTKKKDTFESILIEERPIIIQIQKHIQVEKTIEVETIQFVEVQRIVEKEVLVQNVVEKIVTVQSEPNKLIQKKIQELYQKLHRLQNQRGQRGQQLELIEIPTQNFIVVQQKQESSSNILEEQNTLHILQIPVQNQIKQEVKQIVIEKVQVQKEIIKQIPVQVEIVKQVFLQKEVVKQVQIIKEVPVEVELVKEIVKEIPIQIEKQVVREKIIERKVEVIKEVPIEVEVEIEKQVEKIIEVEVPVNVLKQVPVEIIKEIQIVKEVPVEIEKEVIKEIQVIREVEKQVIKEVPIEKQVIKEIQVIREVEKQVIKEIPYYSSPILNTYQLLEPIHFISLNLDLQFPSISIPQQVPHELPPLPLATKNIESVPCLSSDRSAQQNKYTPSDNIYENSPPIKITENEYDMDILIRYEETEKRLNQQNSFLRDKIQHIVSELDKSSSEISFYRNQAERILNQNVGLKEELQKKSFIKNRTSELEIKLKSESDKRGILEKSLIAQGQELQQLKQLNQTQKRKVQNHCQEKKTLLKDIQVRQQELELLTKKIGQKEDNILDIERVMKILEGEIRIMGERQNKIIQEKGDLEDKVQILRRQLEEYQGMNNQHLELGRLTEEIQKLQEKNQQTEAIYKNQINILVEKYSEILIKNKNEVTELEKKIEDMKEQHKRALADHPTHIQQPSGLKRLEEENQKYKKMIEILNQEIFSLKKKKNPQGSSKMKVASLQRQESSLIKQNSSIKIQDIGEHTLNDDDSNVIEKLSSLVGEYGQKIEKKDREITQLKKLLCSYQETIEKMEFENTHITKTQGQESPHKQNLEMNMYISNVLRKLQLTQEYLRKERTEKQKLSSKIRQLEKKIQHETVVRNVNQSYPSDDSELFEKVVFQLEREKQINEQLREQVYHLKRSKPEGRGNRTHRSIVQSFQGNSFIEPTIPDFLDNENIHTQVQIYKAEYYKALDICRNLKNEVYQLEEQLKNATHCSSHIDLISSLTKKVNQYEVIVIPKLKEEIRKYRDQLQLKNQYESESFRESPVFTPRDMEPQQIIKPRLNDPFIEQLQLQKKRQDFDELEKKCDQSRFLLSFIITKEINWYTKYVLSYRLIELGEEIAERENIESLCPARVQLVNFSQEDLNVFKIMQVASQKVKDKVKFYQAPEVLVGQPQSQKSLVWSLGVIIDQLFTGKCYYKKFAEILGPKNNYEFTINEYQDIGKILQNMIVKDRHQRVSLSDARQRVGDLLDKYEE